MLTTTQAAEILHLSCRRVQALIYAKRLPAHKVGRDWLIDEKDLECVKVRKVGRPPNTTAPCACGCGQIVKVHFSRGRFTRYIHGHNHHKTLDERFWARLDKTDACWNWTGTLNRKGYGQLRITLAPKVTKAILAHRYAYELTYGPVPEGMQVCHHCDNPACCRPEHLFLGTDADNMHDKMRKGRQLRGETHPLAKLTEQDVRDIRFALNTTETQRSIAHRYGVSLRTVQSIATGKTWRHVE